MAASSASMYAETAGGAVAMSSAIFFSFKVHRPALCSGMWVQGLGPDGSTGPFCRDWSTRLFLFAHCPPPSSRIASSSRKLQAERSVKLKSTTKRTNFLELKPIFEKKWMDRFIWIESGEDVKNKQLWGAAKMVYGKVYIYIYIFINVDAGPS